jgi:soluble lytic murein transglycosylase-like protein
VQRHRLWLLAALAIAVPGIVQAQIYASGASQGEGVVLSNFRSAETPLVVVAAPLPPSRATAAPPTASAELVPPVGLRLPAASAELVSLISDVAEQVDLAPELLHAVIAVESRYDRRALSPKGAIGLMQLLPSTARRFGASDPYSARQNVLAGAQYLKWLMALFENDLELVLAAYNAGEQAVLKAGRRIPPFAETQAYVPRVLAYLRCATAPACKPA